jgi:hypothetical protein
VLWFEWVAPDLALPGWQCLFKSAHVALALVMQTSQMNPKNIVLLARRLKKRPDSMWWWCMQEVTRTLDQLQLYQQLQLLGTQKLFAFTCRTHALLQSPQL